MGKTWLKSNQKMRVTQEQEKTGTKKQASKHELALNEFSEDTTVFFKQLYGELLSKRGINILIGCSLQ